MNQLWTDRFNAELLGRPLVGEGSFRLMPNEEFTLGPASGELAALANGIALLVTYTWTHPDDGEQKGALFLTSPEDDGLLTASLIDTWHQQPGPMHLRGRAEGAVVSLTGTYMETWGWEVDLDGSNPGSLLLTMRNVIPAEARDESPPGVDSQVGAYKVMRVQLH